MGNSNNCVSIASECLCIPISSAEKEDRSLLEDAVLFGPGERAVEIYLELKQEELGMHFFPADRLRVSWRSIYNNFNDHMDIGEEQLSAILIHCKLVQRSTPTETESVLTRDERWRNFYSNFKTVNHDSDIEESPKQVKYNLLHILTALLCLSQGDNTMKSLAICEYFTNRFYLKQLPNQALWPRNYSPIRSRGSLNIRNLSMDQYRAYEQRQMKSLFLNKLPLMTIVTAIVNLGLRLVPLHGIDCLQTKGGKAYARYLAKLNKAIPLLIEDIVATFTGDRVAQNSDGQVSVFRFVEIADQIDLYDTGVLRRRGLKLLEKPAGINSTAQTASPEKLLIQGHKSSVVLSESEDDEFGSFDVVKYAENAYLSTQLSPNDIF